MRTIFLLLTVLAGFAAFAMPSQDEIIPEVEFFQPDELDAVETVAAMKRKGATDADCLKVSKALFTMVKNEVKTEQNAIDVAINGAGKCNDKGANESVEAQKEQQKQNKKINSLKKKVTALKMKMIEVTIRRPFEELENGLNSKVSEASFLQELVEKVHAERWKVNNLKKKLDQTKGKGKEADKSVVKARDKAENAKKDCRCKSYKAYQAAVKDGEKNLERHSKAWAKAAAIECATGGKNCKKKAMAVVEKKSPPRGVNKEACPTPKNARPSPVNCKVGGWGRWGRCSKSCGKGVKKRTRSVLSRAKNGGKCRKLLQMRIVCNTKPCPGKRQQCSVKMQHCTVSDKAWKAFKVDLKRDNPHLDVSKLDKKLTIGCELRLSRLQLKKIPESLGCLTQLTLLSLSRNDLKQLPKNAFKGLTSLNNLILDQNRLEQLPENVFKGLTSLQTLGIKKNMLKKLPKNAFKGLTSLKTMSLYKNYLKQLPKNAFEGLTSLKTLVLQSNMLKKFPENLFKGLPSLKTLVVKLQRNGKIKLNCAKNVRCA